MEPSSGLVLAIGAAVIAVYLYIRNWLRDAREPPSVGRYPVIGSHFHLQKPIHLTLYENFGSEPIVRVYFGTQCTYVLNNWASYKAAMVDNAEQLSGRLSQRLTSEFFGDYGGIISSDGDIWREYRRFTLKTLRDFGFGRRGAEEIVAVEAQHLRDTLDRAGGKPLETSSILSTATSNVICQLVFGSRIASEDPKFDEILDLFRKMTQNEKTHTNNSIFLTMLPIVEKLPFLSKLVLKMPGSNEAIEDFAKLQNYCIMQRDKHAAEMGQVDRPKDYIEAHLLHQKSQPEMFNDARLSLAVADLFIAGTDTTANTLRWAILFMIASPDVADKVHQEILTHIGSERLPTMQDKANLHYTQAVIEEVHRRASLLPLGLFHRVTADITVGGVKLKENSVCLFNMYSIHHDAEVFPEPMLFKPRAAESVTWGLMASSSRVLIWPLSDWASVRVWERVWLGWSCSFCSSPSCSATDSVWTLRIPELFGI